MASKHYGDLDTRIDLQRATATRNELNEKILAWSTYRRVWAQKRDASGGESYRAQEVGAEISARFLVRWSSSTATITPTDRIEHGGAVYEITAVRDLIDEGRRTYREIDAVRRADAAPVVVDNSP
jgi:SPP1 family predicted phage head-tail adaptor